MTAPELSASDLAHLLDLRRMLELKRRHNLEALYDGPTLGAFREGAPPLPPTSAQQVGSAMSALALAGFSAGGLLRSAEGFSAGRLPSEVVDRVVVEVLARRKRGEL